MIHMPGVDIDPEKVVELALKLSKSDEKAKNEIKEFIDKVEKAYNALVDSLIPFYHISNEETFKSQFPIQYANFKKYFLVYDNVDIEAQRGKIKKAFEKVTTHKYSVKLQLLVPFYLYAWLGVNRYNKDKQKKLEELSQKLKEVSPEDLLSDNTVPTIMNTLIEKFYERFTSIYQQSLDSQNTQNSQRELKSFLSDLDDDVNVIRGLLGGLRIIRSNL